MKIVEAVLAVGVGSLSGLDPGCFLDQIDLHLRDCRATRVGHDTDEIAAGALRSQPEGADADERDSGTGDSADLVPHC